MEVFDSLWDLVYNYITDTVMWQAFANNVLRIIFIIIGTIVVVKVGRTILPKVFKGRQGSRLRMSEKRETTFEKLVLNVFSYVAYFVGFVMIIDVFVEVKGLIAGAGIVGLAVGFGAQNLVKDIITGFFIIFEDQFSVGDYVRVGTFEGFVEEIGLRTTKIKSWTGELHILPNSSVNEVTNYSVNNSVAVVDVSIAYEEDIEKAEDVLHEVVDDMASSYPEIVRPPEILGVQMLGASDIVIRVIAEVLPMEHWHIAREMRKVVKGRFDEKGIEIPYPRLVTYRREEIQEIEKENAER